MEEQWKDIQGYEGLYQVSNLGKVKSLNYLHTGKEQILKPGKNNGYLAVVLCKNGKVKTFKIHRLVATTFISNPLNKPCVNHIDCNPQNNNVDNLEWVTQRENIQYAYKLGRKKSGFENVSAEQRAINNKKFKSKPIIAINLTTSEEICFESIREAGRQLNLSAGHINDVLKSRYKQTKGYTFKYADPIQ